MIHGAVDSALEQLLQFSPTVLFRQAPDGSFLYLSPNIEHYSGIPAPEWLRRPNVLSEVLYEADAPLLLASRPAGNVIFRLRHRQTGRLTAFCQIRRDVAGAGFEGSWTEWTPNGSAPKLLDDLIWQRTFGLLTMGAAHDINNKLTGITSLSDMYLLEAGPNSPISDGMTAIRASGYSISQLLQQLAAQHQATPGRRELTDINDVVRATAALLRRCVSSQVDLHTELAAQPLPAIVDRVALHRVLLMLAVEAGGITGKSSGVSFAASLADRDGAAWIRIEMAETAPEARPSAVLECAQRFALSHGGTAEVRRTAMERRLVIALPMADAAKPFQETLQRPWLLMIDLSRDGMSDLAAHLESRGISVVRAGEDWAGQLDRNWFDWTAVLIRAPGSQAHAIAAHACKQKWRALVWLADSEEGGAPDINGVETVFSSTTSPGELSDKVAGILR